MSFLTKYGYTDPCVGKPYSPHLAPSDSFILPRVKEALKETKFVTVDAVKEKVTEMIMETILDNNFIHCFEQWEIHIKQFRGHGRG